MFLSVADKVEEAYAFIAQSVGLQEMCTLLLMRVAFQ